MAVALIALHDIGKFSTDFQAKSKEAWPAAILGRWEEPRGRGRHDQIACAMRDGLELKALYRPATAEWSLGDVLELWHAVVGHHGQPIAFRPGELPDGMNGLCWAASKSFCAIFANFSRNPKESLRPTLARSPL